MTEYVRVPKEPTEEMVDAWSRAANNLPDGIREMSAEEANRIVATADWQAMIAAAPKEEVEPLTDDQIIAIIKACPCEGAALLYAFPGDMLTGDFAKLTIQWARAVIAASPSASVPATSHADVQEVPRG